MIGTSSMAYKKLLPWQGMNTSNKHQKIDTMNFKQYLEKQQLAPNTIKGYVRTADQLMSWFQQEGLAPDKIRYNDMLTYIRYAGNRGDSKRHINKQLTVARHYFNYLIKIKKVKDNVAANLFIKGVSRRLPHDLLNEEQLQAIYEEYQGKGIAGKRNKVILGLMIYQALDTPEISKLEAEHLQLKKGKIYVPGSRKSNSRYLPLAAHQVLEIKEYIDHTLPLILAVTEKETTKLFTSMGQSDRLTNSMTKLIKNVQQYIPEVTSVKQIRMSVITHWLEKFNIREVQYMAGHRYVSSTERYQLTNLDDLQNDLNEFHPL